MCFKYVEIVNQELIVKSLPTINHIPDVLIEIAQIRETKFCYFNKPRWYNFFKLLLTLQSAEIQDRTKFILYGDVWLRDFKLHKNKLNNLCPYEEDAVFAQINYALFWKLHVSDLTYTVQQLLNVYNFYYSCKKNLRKILDILFAYTNITNTYFFNNKLTKEDFADLPKNWKDKLPQLDKLLQNNAAHYLRGKTFVQSFDVLRTLKTYSKKYGVYFDKLLNDGVYFQLDDAESVRQVFYCHLHKNNRLLCEPMKITFDLLGKWKLVELNTTYAFVEESAVQNHCIGRGNSYITRVARGEIRAFSFRKMFGENEKRHTIVYSRKGNVWSIEQDRSVNNYSKEKVYDNYTLKCLEVNIERLKKELTKTLRQTEEDLI
jgi:hypothetical protein